MGRNKGNLRVNCSPLIGGDVGIPGLLCSGQHGSQGGGRAVRRGVGGRGAAAGRPGAPNTNSVQSTLRLKGLLLFCYSPNNKSRDYANVKSSHGWFIMNMCPFWQCGYIFFLS